MTRKPDQRRNGVNITEIPWMRATIDDSSLEPCLCDHMLFPLVLSIILSNKREFSSQVLPAVPAREAAVSSSMTFSFLCCVVTARIPRCPKAVEEMARNGQDQLSVSRISPSVPTSRIIDARRLSLIGIRELVNALCLRACRPWTLGRFHAAVNGPVPSRVLINEM